MGLIYASHATPSSPWPGSLATPEPRSGSWARWTLNRLLRKCHNTLTWLPAESERPDHQHVDCLIIGDSYADNVDMGFWCWPNMLAREHGLSSLNAARGGSLCDSARGQIANAVATSGALGLRCSSDTVRARLASHLITG